MILQQLENSHKNIKINSFWTEILKLFIFVSILEYN